MFNFWENLKKAVKPVSKGEEDIAKSYASGPSKGEFEKGVIYKATVIQPVQPNNTVVCHGYGDVAGRIPGVCIWAAGMMSDLFGFKTNYVPPRGSKVLVLIGDGGVNYIIGGYLDALHGDFQGQQRSVLGSDSEKTGDANPYADAKFFAKHRKKFTEQSGAAPYNLGGHPSWDIVEGEIDITNALGVGALFLRHIAQLKASDIAKVECLMIDDMVRIISQTFKHHSAFGDFKIYNDGGRINAQWDGTNSDWEIHGQPETSSEGAPKIPQGDDVGMLGVTSENSAKDAKWRFSHFVGFLGDFISTFVTDPVVWSEGDGFLTQMERSGKFRFHVNEDGTAIASTVNEFIIEKVCRIAVPLEQKREYDPEGNDPAKDLENSLEHIKTWDFGQSGGVNNIHYTVYQIREYTKWMSNKYSKAQFLRMDKDWRVPPESDVPEPDIRGQKHKDKEDANSNISYPEGVINAFATIKIAKDGSIILLDGYDNSVVLSKSGIQLASHNNVQIESAGSINMVAGRDINLLAKNSVDVTATKGGYSLRAESFMQNFCNKGGILFETNQSTYDSPIYEIFDQPNTDQLDEGRIKGIVLKSNFSDMRFESGRSLGIKASQDTLITANATCGVSAGRIQLNDTVEIYPKGAATFEGNQRKDGILGDVTKEYMFDENNDGLGVVKVDGFLLGEKVLANFLMQFAEDLRPMMCPDEDEDGHFKGEDRVIGDDKEWISPEGAPNCHPWHVITTNKKRFETTIERTNATTYKNHVTTAKFVHRGKLDYGTVGATSGGGTTALYQSLTQQSLVNDLKNTHLNKVEYEDWLPNAESDLGDRGTPWPGVNKYLVFNKFETGGKIWEPSSVDPASYMNKADALTSGTIIMKVVK